VEPEKEVFENGKFNMNFFKETSHDLDFLLFICFIKLINQSIIFKNYL